MFANKTGSKCGTVFLSSLPDACCATGEQIDVHGLRPSYSSESRKSVCRVFVEASVQLVPRQHARRLFARPQTFAKLQRQLAVRRRLARTDAQTLDTCAPGLLHRRARHS